jgi:hypothetical protein
MTSLRLIRDICIKDNTIVEKADIETFVSTEGRKTHVGFCTVYGSVRFECRLLPLHPKFSKFTWTDHNLNSFPRSTVKPTY